MICKPTGLNVLGFWLNMPWLWNDCMILTCSSQPQTRTLYHSVQLEPANTRIKTNYKQASSTPFWSLNHHLKPFHFSITSIIIIFLFKIKIVWWNIPRNNGMLLLLLLLLFLFLSFYYQPLIRVVHSYVILKCVRKVHVGPSRYSPLCKKTRCLFMTPGSRVS